MDLEPGGNDMWQWRHGQGGGVHWAHRRADTCTSGRDCTPSQKETPSSFQLLHLSYYMYLNIDLLTHHTHFTHPAPTLSVPVCLSLHFVSAVTTYVCLSTPSSAITQSLASRVTLERDVDDYQLVKDSKEDKEGQSAMLGARYIQGPGNQLSSVLSHRPDKPGNTWLTYNGYTQSCNCFPLHALVVVTRIHAGGQVAYNRSIGLEHPCHHSTPPTQSVSLHRVTWVIQYIWPRRCRLIATLELVIEATKHVLKSDFQPTVKN